MSDGEDSAFIVTKVVGSTVIMRFNCPAQRNPLSLATLQTLQQETSKIFGRQDVHAVIFTGTDDVFASGANIHELQQLNPASALLFSKFGQDLFQSIANASQLTIAAVNGYCMGGGLDLALACDIRVASRNAVFSHPGARLGIITGWGGTQRLPRIIGRARALEFFGTAGRYTSQQALEMGLVSDVGDPVIEIALKVANEKKKVAGSPPPSVKTDLDSTTRS